MAGAGTAAANGEDMARALSGGDDPGLQQQLHIHDAPAGSQGGKAPVQRDGSSGR